MDSNLEQLRSIHSGETAYLVGKGPSLMRLDARYFGPGPVIAMNDALAVVQKLEFSNPLYSFQKDGHEDHMVEPRSGVVLVLQKSDPQGDSYSARWYPEHSPRVLLDPVDDFGFCPTEMTVRICIALIKHMGCKRIVFLCCDSLVNNDLRTYNVKTGLVAYTQAAEHYAAWVAQVKADVTEMEPEYILPMDAGYISPRKEYCIISAYVPAALQEQVNARLQEGWHTIGGVAALDTSHPSTTYKDMWIPGCEYLQAMEKE